MRVLVTGATGFIGNYVVEQLLDRGHQVIASSFNIETAKQKNWFNKVTYIQHTISQISNENLFEKFQKPDCLIHLSWGHLNNFKNQIHIDEELPNHLTFLKNLIENGLKDLTCIGTCLEYGLQEGELHEELEPTPIIAYPIAKNLLRIELEKTQKSTPFSFRWIRLFYMYGKGQSPKSILQLLENALQKNEAVFNMSLGEQVRDYLPVSLVSENIIIFALQQKVSGIINCCSGVPITIKQLVEDYLKTHQKNITLNLGYYPYTDYEPMKFWGSTKKANTIFK
jgi:nucleoside-diphosphate-sugar epimerase